MLPEGAAGGYEVRVYMAGAYYAKKVRHPQSLPPNLSHAVVPNL